MFPNHRVRLSIDRLVFELRTANAIQAHRLRLPLGASYVAGLTGDGIELPPGKANTPCTRFKATIQDPTNFATIRTQLEKIGATAGCLVLLEIALDISIPGAGKAELAEVACDLYRRSTAEPAGHWHAYKRKGNRSQRVGASDVIDRRSLSRLLADGWQLADAFKRDCPPIRRHLYAKFTNENRALPQAHWSARHELTLTGAALRSATLADPGLKGLAEHFRYRRLTDHMNPFIRYVVEWSAKQYGRKGRYRRQHPTRLGVYSGEATCYKRYTEADSDLHEAVRVELRRLERQWKSPKASPTVPLAYQDIRTAPLPEMAGNSSPESPASPIPMRGAVNSTTGLGIGSSNYLSIWADMQIDD